jgi:hypothetical protein
MQDMRPNTTAPGIAILMTAPVYALAATALALAGVALVAARGSRPRSSSMICSFRCVRMNRAIDVWLRIRRRACHHRIGHGGVAITAAWTHCSGVHSGPQQRRLEP